MPGAVQPRLRGTAVMSAIFVAVDFGTRPGRCLLGVHVEPPRSGQRIERWAASQYLLVGIVAHD